MRVAAVFFLVFPALLAGMFACIARAPPKSKPAEGGAYDEERAPVAAPRILYHFDPLFSSRVTRLFELWASRVTKGLSFQPTRVTSAYIALTSCSQPNSRVT